LHAVWEYYLGRREGKKLSDADRREIWERHLEPKVRKGDEEPIIRFLGLFDPVAGNGWDTLTHYSNVRLIDPTLSHNVQAAVSILSIDDNRNPSYRPVLLSGKSSNQQSIEQIWMPGVHGDVGGNSDGVFLSDVALLSMIERVKTYCPELIWDEGYIARRREELGKKVEASISDERFDWKRKLLRWGDRPIATKVSDGRPRFADEKLHPVFDYLNGQEFWVRSKWRTYAPSHVPRDMARFSSSDDEVFRAGCERALANTKRR
jgi:hypothetical protein